MSVSLTKEKDSFLVKEYIDGCERSLAVLIERHKLKIYNFIYSKVSDRDISEDIFQDTFIKVIKTLRKGSYHEEGKFLPWVMRISHNLIIDHFRKSNRIPIFDSKDVPNIESNMIDKQVVEDLKKLIVELPEDQREVLTMRLYKDMSFKEIAEVTGVSINTALGRMRYAVINIRKLIEENQIVLSA
jgi:RNA polymerase sigma-70 factor (ECF subfamily)